MAKNKKESVPALSKKRKSFYDFQKEYPNSDYARMRIKNSDKIYDTKKKIMIAVAAVAFLALIVAAYFVTYTLLDISHAPLNASTVAYSLISER